MNRPWPVRCPLLPFVLVVLLLLGATPLAAPAEAADAEPFQLNLLQISPGEGSDVTTVPADQPFYIRHANGYLDGCVDGEPTQEALGGGSLFELFLDGEPLVGELWWECSLEADGVEFLYIGARHAFVDGLPEGAYEFAATWSDADPDIGVSLEVAVTVIAAPIAIHGVVTDRETREPIVGASIWSSLDANAWTRGATTGEDGRYWVVGLDAGDHVVSVGDAPGYQERVVGPVTYDGSTPVEAPVVVDLTVEPRPSFDDVLSDDVHAWGIIAIAEARITLGLPDGTFRPGENVTRGQMASFLARALDLEPSGTITFSDVPDGYTHAEGISAIAGAEITLGFPDGTFRPGENVTRGQMASFLARALDLDPSDGWDFADVPDGYTHADAISAIAAANITVGLPDGTFRPGENVTRGQMASFLARALELIPRAPFDACLVTLGDVYDASFNQNAYRGLLEARNELEFNVAVIESSSENTIARNIDRFLTQGCDIIVTVGFVMGEATEAAAIANPRQAFAIVDHTYEAERDNLRELTFATDQAAFLAGYLAAAMTTSGTIGTYGGLQIPPVTAFMDGYLAGARFHNVERGTAVTVEGWDGTTGLFIGDFLSTEQGRQGAATLLEAGADIILPVAGPAGAGTGIAIQAHGSGVMMWVDTDGYLTVPQYRSLLLTSVIKRMDTLVYQAILDRHEGAFSGGAYLGTLENGGVALAPFHEFKDDVPQELQDRLQQLTEGIIAGEISVDPDDH